MKQHEAMREVDADRATEIRSMLADVPRVLGDVRGGPGPTLVFVGGLHGNEPAGVLALQRIFARLSDNRIELQGRIVGVAGNRRGLAAGRRYLKSDLNRMWHKESVAKTLDSNDPGQHEDDELRELARNLHQIITEDERVSLLDLHSTSGGGSAFTSLDDTLANRKLAFEIPVPHVLGLEEELAGTLISYVNAMGITAIGFESGQHLDPNSVVRAESAVWIAMAACGILHPRAGEVVKAKDRLSQESRGLPHVVEVRYRRPVASADGFAMVPGFHNFQAVRSGQLLAHEQGQPVKAKESGLILMPLYQSEGEDGYFLVRRVRGFWLLLSSVLRRLPLHRVLHWLPGVQRAEDRPGAFLVDRRRARWLARQIFHLLGYKREQKEHPLQLMVKRDQIARVRTRSAQ